MSVKIKKTIQFVKDNPSELQANAEEEKPPVWSATRTDFKGKELYVEAERSFKHAEDEKRLKLGMRPKMIFGFFHVNGAGAFSDMHTLELDTADQAEIKEDKDILAWLSSKEEEESVE